MDLVKIAASRREIFGKNQSRRLRASGQIPAVAYGKGEPAQNLSVAPKDLVNVLARPLGRNSPIELDVDGKESFTVLLRDYQYHPVTRSLLHADFFKISLDEPVLVDIPLDLVGKAKGVVDGGVLRQVYRRIPVRCLPKDIPAKIVYDVTEIGLDESAQVSALELPPNVTVLLPLDQTFVAVSMEKKAIEEEEAAAAEAAAAAAAAGAVPGAEGAPAAAPGAPGAAPAAAPAEGAAPAKPEGGKGGRDREK